MTFFCDFFPKPLSPFCPNIDYVLQQGYSYFTVVVANVVSVVVVVYVAVDGVADNDDVDDLEYIEN